MRLKTIVSGISYDMAELYLIHCFDNRPLWHRIWKALCPQGHLVARIPLAGASAKGKHYFRFFQDKEADVKSPVVIATHYPCGWYANRPESVVIEHGREVVRILRDEGNMEVLHIHFSLKEDLVTCSFFDPGGMVGRMPIIDEVIKGGQGFEGTRWSKEDIEKVPTPNVVVANTVFGPPPDNGVLVAHDGFVISTTIRIAVELNSGEPVTADAAEMFYVPNY